MGRLLSEDLKRRVKDANDIVSVVRSYGLELKRSGRKVRACCPFHQEKTPSFYVDAEGQYYKCFGCGKGGDVFDFVMEKERVEFPEAVRLLADRAGIPLEYDQADTERYKKEKGWKDYLYRLNAAAAGFYREMLYEAVGRPAREYLQGRRISEELWKQFGLGYAPDTAHDPGHSLLQRLTSQNAPVAALERAGLVGVGERGGAYDYFRGRVMFPIHDTQERVIGFGGRVLGSGEPKYLNTRETPLFTKGQTIYGLFQAREAIVESRRAMLVEGYTDVIMCHQFGVRNVVAALGTAITPEHVRLLRRVADELLLLTDSDAAGARASDRAVEVLFHEEMPARVVRLPGAAKDPCDFLLAEGQEPFLAAAAQAIELFDYKFQCVAARQDLRSTQGRLAAARELMALVQVAPSQSVRETYRHEIAGRLNVPESGLVFERPQAATVAAPAAAGKKEAVPPPEHALAKAERELLRWVFHQPAWLESAVGAVDLAALEGRPERVLGQALLQALADGRLPPGPETLGAPGRSAAGTVAREVLDWLGRQPEGAAAEQTARGEAKQVAIALAEEGPEAARLRADEVFEMLVRAVCQARLQSQLEAAKGEVVALRAQGENEGLPAAEARVNQLRRALAELKRPAPHGVQGVRPGR